MYRLINIAMGGQMIEKDMPDGTKLGIPFDPDNTDYQAYIKWLEESPDNIPLPAEGTE